MVFVQDAGVLRHSRDTWGPERGSSGLHLGLGFTVGLGKGVVKNGEAAKQTNPSVLRVQGLLVSGLRL